MRNQVGVEISKEPSKVADDNQPTVIEGIEIKDSPSPASWQIALGLLTIYLAWGSTYLAIRIAVQTLPPFLMAGARFVVAGVMLTTILIALRRFNVNRQQLWDNAIIGALLLLGGNGLVSWAQQQVPSGMTTLIVSLNPLFVVIAEWIVLWMFNDHRGSKPNRLTFIGLAMGFAGLSILIGPSLIATDATHLDGYRVLGLIVASLCWCIGSMFSRYANNPADPLSGAAVQMLLGGLCLLIASLILGEPFRFEFSQVSPNSLVAWGYTVFIGSLVAFTTYIWLMKHTSPTLVSTYAYVNPIVAVFLGWYFVNEAVSPRIFLAGTIIVAGVATISLSRSKKKF